MWRGSDRLSSTYGGRSTKHRSSWSRSQSLSGSDEAIARRRETRGSAHLCQLGVSWDRCRTTMDRVCDRSLGSLCGGSVDLVAEPRHAWGSGASCSDRRLAFPDWSQERVPVAPTQPVPRLDPQTTLARHWTRWLSAPGMRLAVPAKMRQLLNLQRGRKADAVECRLIGKRRRPDPTLPGRLPGPLRDTPSLKGFNGVGAKSGRCSRHREASPRRSRLRHRRRHPRLHRRPNHRHRSSRCVRRSKPPHRRPRNATC